jgi:hypothetical protein
MLRQVAQAWEILSVMIEDHHIRSIEPVHLMCQHISTLCIGIVGHDKTLALLGVIAMSVKHLTAHHKLKNLSSLAAWGRTHIEN